MAATHDTKTLPIDPDAGLNPTFVEYLHHESNATGLQSWQPQLIHGLTQTPEYTRHLLKTLNPGADPGLRIRQAKLRHRRATHVFRDGGPRVEIVICESALLRRAEHDATADWAAIMRHQTAHLRVLAARPHVTIKILPLSHGLIHPQEPFTLLTTGPHPQNPPVAYSERWPTSHLFTQPDHADIIAEYQNLFPRLLKASVDIKDYRARA